MSLTTQIKEFALDLGYSKVGVIPADSFPEYIAELNDRQDMYGFYINGLARPLLGADPRVLMPTAKSIITMVYDYAQKSFPQELTGKIGRYYQARCYNAPPERINGARVRLMREFLSKLGCEVGRRISVPERLVAAKAGIVNYGKNTFAYTKEAGSFILLTSFVVDKELDYELSPVELGCPEGCSLCLKACPTQAIYEPLKIDPRSCIAFNTFMSQDHIAGSRIEPEIRRKMGTKIHGCDVCQEICPRNQPRLKAVLPEDEYLKKIAPDFSLPQILNMTDEFYATRARSLMYSYINDKKYLQRNAAIALGNLGDSEFVADLAVAMGDAEELVREYAAWALGEIGGSSAKQILEESLVSETSVAVKTEIENALLEIE